METETVKPVVVNFHVLNDSIVLNFSGKTINIANDDRRYGDVLAAIKEKRLQDIPALADIAKGFENSGIELRDGVLFAGALPIPTELNNRILKFKDMGLPFDSLLAFWENLKANPSFNSRKMLFKFLEHNGHPLTEDGCFIAYRGVTQDFKDKHTKTFDNSPGKVCEMPRELVNDDPTITCSDGLHCATFSYAQGFGEKLVEVKVNPKDVVCVPIDYDGTKMRICRFEVVQECAAIRKEELYNHGACPVGEGCPVGEVDDEEDEEQAEEYRIQNLRDNGLCVECEEDVPSFANFCPECGVDLN